MDPTVTTKRELLDAGQDALNAPPAPKRSAASRQRATTKKAAGGDASKATESRRSATNGARQPATRPRRPRSTPEPVVADEVAPEGAEDAVVAGDAYEASYDAGSWATSAADGEAHVEAAGPRSPFARVPRGRIPALAATAIIVILAAAVVYFGVRVSNQDSTNSLRSSALTAATTYGGYLSSYDYHNLTTSTSAWSMVESHATAKFRQDFMSTSGQLATVLRQYKATSQGKVLAAGISSLSSSQAVVLVFIDQTVTNSVQKPNTTTQPLRVELTLARQHGKWLIDNIQVPK